MWVRSVTAQGWGLGNSSESWMMQETPRFLMNKNYLVRLTGRERDEVLRYLRFLLFKSYFQRAGQAPGSRGRQLNVRLILEQNGTKETKEDPIPFSFVVSRSLALTLINWPRRPLQVGDVRVGDVRLRFWFRRQHVRTKNKV